MTLHRREDEACWCCRCRREISETPGIYKNVFAALSGGVKFSKVDLKHAYLQMEVAEDSRPLLTINTEKDLYRYNHLVYGVASAPAIWLRSMDMVLQGIPGGVRCIIDDMIITGKDDAEHLQKCCTWQIGRIRT